LSDAPQHVRSALPDRWSTIAAIALSFGACALGLVLAYFHKVGTYAVETDFYGLYVEQALGLLAGEPYTFTQNPPGYVLLLGGASRLIGDPFVAGKVLSAVAAGALGWLTYGLVRPLFGARVALASTMLVVAALIPYSFIAGTDLVGAALIVLPIVVFLRRDAITPGLCAAAGAAAGVAYMVRANALFLVIGFALALLLLLGRDTSWVTRVRNVALMIGAFVLVTSPWMLYNWQVAGSPLASRTYLQVAAHFYHPEGDWSGTALEELSGSFASMGDVIRHDPKRVASVYLKDALVSSPIQLAREALRLPLVLFAAMGLLLLLVRWTPRRLALLLIFALGYLLLGLVGFYVRYYLFLFPLLFLLVAYALLDRDTAVRLPGRRLSRVPVNAIVFAGLLAFVLRASLLDTRGIIANEPRQLFDVAEVLKQHASAEDMLIARKPHLAYLAGVRYDFPLANTPGEFHGWARENGARFLLYNDEEAALWRGLQAFADPGAVSPDFRLLYRHERNNTLLYEIMH
jgi:4-amino-4-deoxy-L-arabinose transferase-like glycosyltransferase